MQIGGDLAFGFFYSDQCRGIKARQKLFWTSFLKKTGDLQMIQEMSLDLFGERFAVFISSPGAVVGFESAAKIQKATGARRKRLKKAETAAEAAMHAELAAHALKTSVKMKKGGLNNETG